MPIWLQLLLQSAVFILVFKPKTSASHGQESAGPEAEAVAPADLWRSYYALQNALVSLSRATEAVDTNLGLVVVAGIAGFTYYNDKAQAAIDLAHGLHEWLPTYRLWFGWALLLPVAFATIALIRLCAEEPPDPKAFWRTLQTEQNGAIRAAIDDMVGIYERNLSIRTRKQNVLVWGAAAYAAILLADALWPSAGHLLQSALRVLHLGG